MRPSEAVSEHNISTLDLTVYSFCFFFVFVKPGASLPAAKDFQLDINSAARNNQETPFSVQFEATRYVIQRYTDFKKTAVEFVCYDVLESPQRTHICGCCGLWLASEVGRVRAPLSA